MYYREFRCTKLIAEFDSAELPTHNPSRVAQHAVLSILPVSTASLISCVIVSVIREENRFGRNLTSVHGMGDGFCIGIARTVDQKRPMNNQEVENCILNVWIVFLMIVVPLSLKSKEIQDFPRLSAFSR